MGSTFRDWARAEGVETRGPLNQIKDARIAIDAEEYLHNLITSSATREPLLPAHAGLPFALQKHVDNDLANFKEYGIKPIFVFSGLDVVAKDRAAVAKESRRAAKTLDDAWSTYDAGHGDSAVAAFGKACSYKTYHIVRWLQAYLQNTGISNMVALYNAAPQMVYIESEGMVDALVGSASCLTFGSDRVITSFDWESKQFSWIEVQKCLQKLMLNRDQFVELLLLAGCSIVPPLPEIDSDTAVSNKINAARTLFTRANNDGHLACFQNAKDEDYINTFQKAKSVIKHPIILFADGKIEAKNQSAAPNDVHFFIGQRLPDEVYMYLSRGVIGARVLSWRTRNEIFEVQPLDGGTSQAYREMVSVKLNPIRAQTLAIFTRLLHRYYQKTDVEVVAWFKEDEKHELRVPDLWEEAAANADSWHLQESTLPTPTGIEIHTAPLLYALESLSDGAAARKTVTPRPEGKAGFLTKPMELLANTVFRFLHDRGYINPDHTLSAWGKTLKAALDRAIEDGYITPDSAREGEESILMAIELLRLDALNSKLLFLTPPYAGAPLRGTDADKAHTLLVSRLASLGTFAHHSIGYTGPLSRHLLAYHQMAAAVRNSLRDLIEVHACNMLLSGVVTRDLSPKHLSDLGASLPFVREPDLGLALIVKSYLDELSNEADKRADITGWFNHATDIEGDLKKAWKLWAAVNAGVQAGDSSIINNEVRKLFRTTDEWLQGKLASASTAFPVAATNGEVNGDGEAE